MMPVVTVPFVERQTSQVSYPYEGNGTKLIDMSACRADMPKGAQLQPRYPRCLVPQGWYASAVSCRWTRPERNHHLRNDKKDHRALQILTNILKFGAIRAA